MKTFQEYIQENQLTEYKNSVDLFGKKDVNSEKNQTLSSAIEAFKIIFSKDKKSAIHFLNKMAESIPEAKMIIDQNKLNDFSKSHHRKNSEIITKGFGHISTQDADEENVVAANPADSYHNPVG
jgi:hypothetical protein